MQISSNYFCQQPRRWYRKYIMADHKTSCRIRPRMLFTFRVHHQRFPKSKEDLLVNIRGYWTMKDDLYLIKGVPFKGKKMLIPKTLRPTVLEGLHAAHQGVSSMVANVRERFFWLGLDATVRLQQAQCWQCNEQAPSQSKEEPIEATPPEYPFQQVLIDLFKLLGFSYLIYIDAYSGWIEVSTLTYATFNSLKRVLLMYFSIFRVPQELASDGGPLFDSSQLPSTMEHPPSTLLCLLPSK